MRAFQPASTKRSRPPDTLEDRSARRVSLRQARACHEADPIAQRRILVPENPKRPGPAKRKESDGPAARLGQIVKHPSIIAVAPSLTGPFISRLSIEADPHKVTCICSHGTTHEGGSA